MGDKSLTNWRRDFLGLQADADDSSDFVVKHVIKRDGQLEIYNKQKIFDAINKAAIENGIDDVKIHCRLCTLGISIPQIVHQNPVVVQGHLRNLGGFVGKDYPMMNGAVKDGEQGGNELIVRRRGDGIVELLFALIPLGIASEDHCFVQLPKAEDGLQLLVAGTQTGIVCGLRLEHQPHFIKLLRRDVGVLNFQNVVVGVDAFALGDKCANPAPHLDQPACGQNPQSLPQGGSADLKLIGQFDLVWKLVPRKKASVCNHVRQLICNPDGQRVVSVRHIASDSGTANQNVMS